MCAAAKVLEKFSTRGGVRGVTSVDKKLYVLLKRDKDQDALLKKDEYQVAVYSIDDYQQLSSSPLYVTGTIIKDITSCERRKCVYMSDWDHRCIRRYELASSATSEWSVLGWPLGLSVTPSGNLLVACQNPDKLVELSAADSGEIVHEIALQPSIEWPHDCVQLTNGQIVVCYGYDPSPDNRSRHGVCVVGHVDDGGNVTTIRGVEGGFDDKQLKWPRHFAVAEDTQSQFTGLFVADESNNTVVLLSPTLEFERCIIEGLSKPCRVYFHQPSQRLFVGQLGGGVSVIQL